MPDIGLTLKKQYVRVFNGKATPAKVIASMAFVGFGAPFSAHYLMDEGAQLSTSRDSSAGAVQYAALDSRIDQLKTTWNKSSQHYHALDRLTQDVAIHGNNMGYILKIEEEKKNYRQTHEKFIRDLQLFRDAVLVSRGLSEQDAVTLFEKVEQKTGAVMFPGRTSWRKEMAYLEECQTGAFQQSVIGSANKGYSDIVLSCSFDTALKTEGGRDAIMFLSSIGGAVTLFALSIIGSVFRENLPHDQQRADARAADRARRLEREKQGKKTVVLKLEK